MKHRVFLQALRNIFWTVCTKSHAVKDCPNASQAAVTTFCHVACVQIRGLYV